MAISIKTEIRLFTFSALLGLMEYMSRKKNGWLNAPAADWHSDLGYHGFSRDENYQCYRVVLSVLGKQVHLIVCKSQEEAAKAYDAALWKLLPFTPARAKPNFPDGFSAISQHDVDALCPYANELFEQCSNKLKAKGVSIESLLQLRELQEASKSLNLHSDRDLYSDFSNAVKKAAFALFGEKIKLTQRRMKVNLVKFPDLVVRFNQIEASIADTQNQLEELDRLLTSHRELYQKFEKI